MDGADRQGEERPSVEHRAPPRLGRRDAARLKTMFAQHYDMVWRTLRYFGVPDKSVEDAAQQVFLVAAEKLSQITTGKERSFLYGSARRVASDQRLAASRQHDRTDPADVEAAPADSPTQEQLLDDKRRTELLRQALHSLDPELRAVFVAHEIEGFTAAEIAQIEMIPAGTVASRLRRARRCFETEAERIREQLRAQGVLL